MKNKGARANNTEKSERLPNPLKTNLNLKNREKLRKKLKRLLEKDKKAVSFTSDEKIVKNVKNVVSDLPKAKATKNKVKPQKKNLTDVEEKTFHSSGENQKDKSGLSRKRKLKKKLESPKKAAKHFKKSENVSVPNVKKPKLEEVTPKESDAKCPSQKKIRKGKVVNKLVENNVKKHGQPKSKNKIKKGKKIEKPSPKVKKTVKQLVPKANVNAYRGPFRPDTSDSEVDDCVKIDTIHADRGSKANGIQTETKVSNNEQALTRVVYKSEESSNDGTYENESSIDGSYDSEDHEYTSTDDFDEYDINSDESTEYGFPTGEYNICSESDHTYEPPEHLAEDVYIANGTAVKHDLLESNDCGFDSESSFAQIIELPPTPNTSVTTNTKPVTESSKRITKSNQAASKACESDDSCPELVPIHYINNTPESDSDCSFDLLSCSTSCSESCCSSEASEYSAEPPQMTPAIFQADKTAKGSFDINIFNMANVPSSKPITTSPLDRIANRKGNISSYKVITTNNEIVDHTSKDKPHKTSGTRPVKPLRSNVSSSEEEVITPGRVILITDSPSPTKNMNEVQTEDTPKLGVTPPDKEAAATRTKTSHVKLPFRTLFFNAINSNHVIVLLKEPLYMYGTVKLKLLAGSVEIFGYNPKRDEVLEIFSPRGYSSLKIEPSKISSTMNAPISEKEILSLAPYFIRTDLEEVIQKFDAKTDAIVILERNDRSKKVNMLRKYMVEHLFPNMNSLQSDRPFYTSEFLLRCIITLQSQKALIVDPKWRSITVNNNSRVMVVGGKSVGKTTLVRYLINKNLNNYQKILLIDLDIGQPEIFVPQTVSATTLTTPLLGPGYFLNKEPDKAFLVGQTNVVLLPQRYIENVQALMDYCHSNEEYYDIPWIVNSMGYNKGFGDELLAIICNLLHPTNIVQIQCKNEINNFDVIMSKDNIKSLELNILGDMLSSYALVQPQHQLTLMNSVIPNDRTYQKEWDMKPRDMRLAMIISRLSNILKGHAEWLTDIKPVCASIDDIKVINMGHDQINKEDVLQTLVGNLIYLCRQESGKATECFGIGIVRGIDYPLKQIYLLPAGPLEVLEEVNCLAVCGIPLPSSILTNQGPKVKGVAPYVYNTVDKAASMYIQQIYHRPQSFLTGRHKSLVE